MTFSDAIFSYNVAVWLSGKTVEKLLTRAVTYPTHQITDQRNPTQPTVG